MAKILIIGDNLSGEGMWHFFKNHHELATLNVWATEKEESTWFNYVVICEPALTKNYGLTKKRKTEDFRCDVSLIEELIQCHHAGMFIISSAIEPGTVEKLKSITGKRIVNLICEKEGMVFGGNQEDTKEAAKLFSEVGGNKFRYLQVEARVCEMFKYSTSVFESVQSEVIQKIKNVSDASNVDFNQLREAWLVLKNLDLTKVTSTPSDKSTTNNFIAYASAIGCETDILKINV